MAIESTLARLKNYFIGWHKANYEVLHQMTEKIEAKNVPVSSNAVYKELGMAKKSDSDCKDRIGTGTVWGHICAIWKKIGENLIQNHITGENNSVDNVSSVERGEYWWDYAKDDGIMSILTYFSHNLGINAYINYTKQYETSEKNSPKNNSYNSLVRPTVWKNINDLWKTLDDFDVGSKSCSDTNANNKIITYKTIWGNICAIWKKIGNPLSEAKIKNVNAATSIEGSQEQWDSANNEILSTLTYFSNNLGIGNYIQYKHPHKFKATNPKHKDNDNTNYNSLVYPNVWVNINELWNKFGKNSLAGQESKIDAGQSIESANNWWDYARNDGIISVLTYFKHNLGIDEYKTYVKEYQNSTANSPKNGSYNSLVRKNVWKNINDLWDLMGDSSTHIIGDTRSLPGGGTIEGNGKKVWSILHYIINWINLHWKQTGINNDGILTKEQFRKHLDNDRQVLVWDKSKTGGQYNHDYKKIEGKSVQDAAEKVVIYRWGKWGMVKFNEFSIKEYMKTNSNYHFETTSDGLANYANIENGKIAKGKRVDNSIVLMKLNSKDARLKNFIPAVRSFGSAYTDIDWLAIYKVGTSVEKVGDLGSTNYGIVVRCSTKTGEPTFSGSIVYPINLQDTNYTSTLW